MGCLSARLMRVVRDRRGAAAVEFAIVAPLFIWLLMAIIEFGIIVHISSLANYAANNAARMAKTGSLYGGTGTRQQIIENTVRNTLQNWVSNSSDLTVTPTSFGSFSDVGFTTGTAGLGSGGQVVLYSIVLRRHVLTPIFGDLISRGTGYVNIRSTVLTQNEAF